MVLADIKDSSLGGRSAGEVSTDQRRQEGGLLSIPTHLLNLDVIKSSLIWMSFMLPLALPRMTITLCLKMLGLGFGNLNICQFNLATAGLVNNEL